jgi:hypothetical protein
MRCAAVEQGEQLEAHATVELKMVCCGIKQSWCQDRRWLERLVKRRQLWPFLAAC